MGRSLGDPVSTLSVSAVRSRLAAAITTALGASGWAEATVSADQFPGSTSSNRAHKAFAVSISRTSPASNQRQTRSEGAMSVSTVRVRWAWEIAALDQVASYDAGLDGEAALILAVMGASLVDLHLVLGDVTRSVDDQGWLTGEITVEAIHRIALT